jgi:hypothetical protein
MEKSFSLSQNHQDRIWGLPGRLLKSYRGIFLGTTWTGGEVDQNSVTSKRLSVTLYFNSLYAFFVGAGASLHLST